MMAEADWIIDMGPEAGNGGGKVVVAGPPSAVVKVGASHTGMVLKDFLRDRGDIPRFQAKGAAPLPKG